MMAAFLLRTAPLRRGQSWAWAPGWSLGLSLAGVMMGIALATPAVAQAPPTQAARYPLDPVCPWGRLADGHGLLVRCLERGEAQALLAGAGAPAAAPTVAPPSTPASTRPSTAPTPVPPPAPYGSVAPAPYGIAPAPYAAVPPAAVTPGAAAPGAFAAARPAGPPGAAPSAAGVPPLMAAAPAAAPGAAPAPGAAAAPAVPPVAAAGAAASLPPLAAAVPATSPGSPARSTKLYRRVSVREVGSAIADTGELPEAQLQLRKVQDRYAQCVGNNGGMEGEAGRVTVRFLVRERGRAEGVAVKDRQGVSLAAAKCVAEVVDRRFVGYPAAPIVGATLSIDFMPEGAAR